MHPQCRLTTRTSCTVVHSAAAVRRAKHGTWDEMRVLLGSRHAITPKLGGTSLEHSLCSYAVWSVALLSRQLAMEGAAEVSLLSQFTFSGLAQCEEFHSHRFYGGKCADCGNGYFLLSGVCSCLASLPSRTLVCYPYADAVLTHLHGAG